MFDSPTVQPSGMVRLFTLANLTEVHSAETNIVVVGVIGGGGTNWLTVFGSVHV